eukprot:CAMPEP_0113513304 /NCGR_PEP_ID=MMETSP0014_2-20120614/39787_1 /TAXON_ID=2857 /ORGANISM="Nitzschia sp." /LENGTH=962 /DNA_ID=CAMNT_0000409691 /DNA_START=328 /DNA_END=3213 /DNA_ORIENTATION=- /assembly_acc=CAM_ASM_000159
MKRALAERAKQSGLPNGGVLAAVPVAGSDTPVPKNGSVALQEPSPVPAPVTASDVRKQPGDGQQPPPIKIPRRNSSSQQEGAPSTPAGMTTNSSSRTVAPVTGSADNIARSSPGNTSSQRQAPDPPRPSPRPTKKRQRDSIVKLEEEDEEEDENSSAFYLKHQNRALSSELRSVKYQLSRLERERDYRREQCKQAVDNLGALHSIWTQLESALQNKSPPSCETSDPGTTADVPFSTGSGTSVELVDALLSSVSSLASRGDGTDGEEKKTPNGVDGPTSMDIDGEEGEESGNRQIVDDVSFLSKNINDRAAALQKWIWTLLQRVNDSAGANGASDVDTWTPPSTFELQEQLALLESKNLILQEELKELARSRDEIAESDRRVRRGLYRLAAGRMDLKEVLKAIATSDDDKEAAEAWMETSSSTKTETASAVEKIKAEEDGDESAAASSEEVAKLKKQVADLQDVSSARDSQIQKLLSEREEQTKRINSLLLQENKTSSDVPTGEDVQKSEIFLEQSSKLVSFERKFDEMSDETAKMKDEWAQALADAEASKNAMEDMQAKHLKRWAELAEENPDIGPEDGEGTLPGNKAEEIAILQHKLTQALEGVRQAEATRNTLNEAVNLNASLQAKVEEFKSKYSALQAEKAARTGNQTAGNGSSKDSSTTDAGEPKPSADKSDKSDRSAEKLQRDYKRARKELAAAQASKEAAKAKLERAEKEREFLNQMNSRLLKQASEKDEINAKSLSTILHLKQLTEQISKEKDNLEQQVKSAQQVALAARLASNARERLSEEFDKERKRLEDLVKDWEGKCALMTSEKEAAETNLFQEKSRMSGLINDAEKAKERCEELVSESTKLQEEKQAMMESLAVAQREASEAAEMTQRIARSSGSGMVAGFTAEQLHTQVNVLKSRLACPVCNVRDKKCILIRCRHMFCKDCVDENIKNRSRKCPACGIRFDTKDVADVW